MKNKVLLLIGLWVNVAVGSLTYAQTQINTFPTDLTPSLDGQEVIFSFPLTVTQTLYRSPQGNVILSPSMLYSPTEVVLPGESALAMAQVNESRQIILNASSFSYVDKDNTLRTGSKVQGLRGILSYSDGQYSITPTVKPVFTGNERTLTAPNVGDCNLKVASFNVEFYIASPSVWRMSGNNGARNQSEFNRQRTKVLAALKGLDADVYALCEVGQGKASVTDLVKGLNEITASDHYDFIDDNDNTEGIYTKNVFIYNKTKVTPYGKLTFFGAGNFKLRQIAQAFDLNSNGERLIVTVNHLKSKGSGYGNNADQGDGQGASNLDRVVQAANIASKIDKLITAYRDSDILVVGDMNTYTMEDPFREFQKKGLINELNKYSPTDYSYVYRGNAGYLDHSWSTPSLSRQVTGAHPWHINADEPSYFEYSNSTYGSVAPFRCSDHDPIITGINLKPVNNLSADSLLIIGDPSQGSVTLRTNHIDKVELISFDGMLVNTYTNPSLSGDFVLNTKSLAKGLYVVRAMYNEKTLAAKLLVP